MALIFTESFDSGLTAAQMATSGKWTGPSGTQTIGFGNGRNGSNAWFAGIGGHWITPIFPVAQRHDTLIIGGAFKFNTTTSVALFELLSGGTYVSSLRYNGVSNLRSFTVFRGRTSDVAIGTTAGAILDPSVWNYVELKIKLHDTLGTVDLRVNGMNVLSLTDQDTNLSSGLMLYDQVKFAGSNGSDIMDDIYICNGAGTTCNDFLGDVRIECIIPDADGANNGLTTRNVNKLPNANTAGFETDISGWAVDSNCTILQQASPARSGAGGGKITTTVTGFAVMRMAGQGMSAIPVNPNTPYVVGVWIYNSNNNSFPMYIGIDWYTSDGTYISRSGMTNTGVSGSNSTWNFATAANTSPATVGFATPLLGLNSTNNTFMELDDVVFAEGSALLAGTYPTGVTTHYTAVNDLPNSATINAGDNSYVVGQADDLLDTWGHASLASVATQPVKGLMVWAYSRSDTTSPKNMALVARTAAGTEALSADKIAPQTYGMVGGAHELDPAGAAWTVESVNAAEFGVQIRP